jgi:selenium-binding protein 1
MGNMARSLAVSKAFAAASLAVCALSASPRAAADETCNSPYVGNLIKGQEDYVYVWTLGVEGVGDGSDKLVTVDVNPSSPSYGKGVHKVSVGSRGEAHHMGLTDDRRFLWAGGLDDSKIYVFDISKNPSRPGLVKTIADLPAKTGYVGARSMRCRAACCCGRALQHAR